MHLLERFIGAGRETRRDMEIVLEKLEENYKQCSYYERGDKDLTKLVLPLISIQQYFLRLFGGNYWELR